MIEGATPPLPSIPLFILQPGIGLQTENDGTDDFRYGRSDMLQIRKGPDSETDARSYLNMHPLQMLSSSSKSVL